MSATKRSKNFLYPRCVLGSFRPSQPSTARKPRGQNTRPPRTTKTMPIGSGGINSEIPRAISKTPISLGGFVKLPWFSSGRTALQLPKTQSGSMDHETMARMRVPRRAPFQMPIFGCDEPFLASPSALDGVGRGLRDLGTGILTFMNYVTLRIDQFNDAVEFDFEEMFETTVFRRSITSTWPGSAGAVAARYTGSVHVGTRIESPGESRPLCRGFLTAGSGDSIVLTKWAAGAQSKRR